MKFCRIAGRRDWWVRAGRWSVGWHEPDVRGFRPLSERHGSTRSWWWGGWLLRRHGTLDRS